MGKNGKISIYEVIFTCARIEILNWINIEYLLNIKRFNIITNIHSKYTLSTFSIVYSKINY